MNSSITMQDLTQTHPAGPQIPAPQNTSCSRMPNLLGQVLYYVQQQRMQDQQNNQQSHGLWNDRSSSQHVSSSPNSQSGQMPQTWFTNSQNQFPGNSASMRAAVPNGQFAQLPAGQHGTPTRNLNHYPQDRNTVPQQNFNMQPMQTVHWPNSVYSNARYATDQHHSHQNMAHQSAVPQYQSFSRHHNQMQINHQPAAQPQKTDLPVQILSNPAQQTIQNNQVQPREGTGNCALYNSSNHFPATLQRPIAPSQPSNYSYNRTQVQHSSQIQHQPSPYRMTNSANYSHLTARKKQHQSLPQNPPHPPEYASQHFIIQNESRSELPQVQPQTTSQQQNTTLVSGHHNTCPFPVPASHRNSQPQALQLNNAVTGSTRSYQVTPSTPTSEAATTIRRQSTHANLLNLLLDNTEVPAQGHSTSPPSCHKAKSTIQGQTPSHITTQASNSQRTGTAPYSTAPVSVHSKELPKVSEYQTTAIRNKNEHVLAYQLKAQDVRSTEVMRNSRLQNIKGNDGHGSNNRHGDTVQYCEDIAETQELVMALQKVLQQSHKSVAVVQPISQQVPSPEKINHVTKSSDDSLPIKINVVWTLVKDSKNVEQEPNLPKETLEELLHFYSVPQEKQEHKPEDGSTVDSSIPDAQCTDIPQSKTCSATSQDPACSSDLTSKSPKSNKGKWVEIEVRNFTSEKLKKWVKVLEMAQEGMVKEPVADVEQLLLDLFWGGSAQNVINQVHAISAELSKLFSEVSLNNVCTAKFKYVRHKDLKMLANGYHILKNDTTLPTEEFRSSWLNVDGQPADVDMVLAEPLVDMTYPDAFHKGFSTLNISPEFQDSRKAMPPRTDCQNDQKINKQLADLDMSESKSTEQVSKKQAESEKEESGNLDDHQKQDMKMSSEESEDTNGMADTMKMDKKQTECEQVCGDVSEDIAPSSEIAEQKDLSSDLDSSNDSQLLELSLLTTEDAKTLFKEISGCDLQRKLSQLCQDDTKVSATLCKESNDFCSSANQIKFTCPHVMDIDWDGEHFCSRCWEETPVLDLDLEETLFSPKESSPNTSTPPEQGCHDQITQSAKTDSNCTVESNSIADYLIAKVDVFDVTDSKPNANPSDAKESCSSLSVNLPVKEPQGPVCKESVGSSLPVKEAVSKQTKTPRDEVLSPKSPPSTKVKLAGTLGMPAEDGRFTVDIVTNNGSDSKSHSTDLTVTLAGQNCKNDMKEFKEVSKSPIKMKTQLNAQCLQSGPPDPNCTALSESTSIADSLTQKVDVFKVANPEPDPNPSDVVNSSSSPIKEPHGPLCSKSVGFSLSTERSVCETVGSIGPELPEALSCTQNTEKPVSPEQTKPRREEDSPPQMATLSTTTDIPAKDGPNSADTATKKVSTTKLHPSDLCLTPAKYGQNCKGEKKSPSLIRIQMNDQILQSVKPDSNVTTGSENRRHSSSSSAGEANMTITEQDLNPDNSLQSCRSPSGTSLDKHANGRPSSGSVGVSVPIEVSNFNSVSGAELPKAPFLPQNRGNQKPVIQPQTKRPSNKCSPLTYPPCKKQKFSRTISEPVKDDLFTPDIVVHKNGSPKLFPTATPTKDISKQKERGGDKNSSIVLNFRRHQHSGQTKPNALSKWLNPSVKSQGPNVTLSPTKPEKAKQNKGQKKIRFAPYGFNNVHNRSKFSALPVYIKISNRSEVGKSYTDMPSAKEKVYSQWSSTFVQPKLKKMHRKHKN